MKLDSAITREVRQLEDGHNFNFTIDDSDLTNI